ncbi:MAG: alpha-galactosidase, partial [Acidobacteriaceae bacterium]|nr:alpha-galactosidase [Acidobacteriaceae bacterium]
MSKLVVCFAALLSLAAYAAPRPQVQFDQASRVFELDGGNVSYVFGVNAQGELQQIYWGGRLAQGDSIPRAVSVSGSSFDPAYTATPQEYAGWGAGLYAEPALKVTFASGNRDLVLHYSSHKMRADGVDVVLKDIASDIFVTLHYAIDPASGILARSATIENREQL